MATTRTEHPNSPSMNVHGTTSTTAGAGARTLDVVALVLMIIGGINWGLVGLFQVDLVASIFGPMSTVSRVVYVIVGIAALYGIVTAIRAAQRRA